jgi:hypothetical protein
MSKETLHILHHSAQWADTTAQSVDDLEFCFSQEPDLLTFTELHPNTPRRSNMIKIARNRGYRPVYGRGETCMAIRTGNNIKIRNHGAQPVHGGVPQSAPGQGFYGPKFLFWGHFDFHGQDIYASVTHWATRAQEGGIYATHFSKMVAAVVRKLNEHNQKGIAFAMGDINADPDEGKYPRERFRDGGLLTCWDESNHEPPTRYGRNIDIVARHKEEKRAEFKRFKVHQGHNSDHRPFSVWYEIDTTKKKSVGDKGGKDKDPDKKGPKYVTAGDRSFKDYKDRELYDLPQATDDSDLFNG